MSRRAFEKIAAGLEEAIDIAHGDAEPAGIHMPAEIDVRSIRQATGLSQGMFSQNYGFTIEQIRSWEQGRARPLGGVRAYLLMIETDAAGVAALLRVALGNKAA